MSGFAPALGDTAPTFSPDGRLLAFARYVANFVCGLYVLPLTPDLHPAGEPIRIADQRYPTVAGIAWTADRRDVVFGRGVLRANSSGESRLRDGKSREQLPFALPAAGQPAIARTRPRLVYSWLFQNLNLWRLDARTGERQRLIGSTYEIRWPGRYSPDGRKIAFQSNRSGNLEVWTCNADGTNCQQLTFFNGPQCGSPRWSPDSRWLAFDSRSEGQPEIYVMPADGGAPQRRTQHEPNDITPSWSSDGRWVYFASDRSGRFEIWKVPRAGGEAVQVTRHGGRRSFEPTPGTYLYYDKLGSPGFFRMPVQGGEETEITQVRPGGSATVTAKGIYFMPDARRIQFLDTATGQLSTVVTLEKPGGFPIISPDGGYIAWVQADGNTTDLMLVENFR